MRLPTCLRVGMSLCSSMVMCDSVYADVFWLSTVVFVLSDAGAVVVLNARVVCSRVDVGVGTVMLSLWARVL